MYKSTIFDYIDKNSVFVVIMSLIIIVIILTVLILSIKYIFEVVMRKKKYNE